MQGVRSIYIFDLDGVITDPKNSKVDAELMKVMRQLLVAGCLLAINTGRSFDWVKINVVDRLVVESLSDKELRRFIVICEKGGEKVQWQKDGWVVRPSQFALLPALHQQSKEIFEGISDQLPTMFWDQTKRTMATIEKLLQAELTVFHAEQKILVDVLNKGLSGKRVRIDATTIATDIESPSAGKHAGAELIYEWAKKVTTEPSSYICLGDSISDYEMARYFADQGAKTTFVYVGEPTDKIHHHKRVEFIATEAHYASGTREFFEVGNGE